MKTNEAYIKTKAKDDINNQIKDAGQRNLPQDKPRKEVKKFRTLQYQIKLAIKKNRQRLMNNNQVDDQKQKNQQRILRSTKKKPKKTRQQEINQQEERKQYFRRLSAKCQEVLTTIPESMKYFSKSVYSKIIQDINIETKLNLSLKQDQRKSLQCNLIYSFLRLFRWEKVTSFFKKRRQKVKMLKVSTFQQYILKGGMFSEEKNKQQYKITTKMLEECLKKLRNRQHLYRVLFQKKIYTKLYEKQKHHYLQKMIIFIYKTIQFTKFIEKFLNQNRSQVKQQEPQHQQYDHNKIKLGVVKSQYKQRMPQILREQEEPNFWQLSQIFQKQHQIKQKQKDLKVDMLLIDYNKLFPNSNNTRLINCYETNEPNQPFIKPHPQERKKLPQIQDLKVSNLFDLSNDDIPYHSQPRQIQQPKPSQQGQLLGTNDPSLLTEAIVPEKEAQKTQSAFTSEMTQGYTYMKSDVVCKYYWQQKTPQKSNRYHTSS